MAEQKPTKEQNLWHFVFSLIYSALLVFSIYLLNSLGKLKFEIPVFDFIILGLAIFRLTHLLVYDYIMHFIRDYFEEFQGGPFRTIANLLECPWCTSVWVSLFAGFLYFLTPYAWYVFFVLAIAGVGVFIQIIAVKIFGREHLS